MISANERRQLDKFSSASDVLECVLNAYCQRTPAVNNVYDDDNDTIMRIDDARDVIAQLRENDE